MAYQLTLAAVDAATAARAAQQREQHRAYAAYLEQHSPCECWECRYERDELTPRQVEPIMRARRGSTLGPCPRLSEVQS